MKTIIFILGFLFVFFSNVLFCQSAKFVQLKNNDYWGLGSFNIDSTTAAEPRNENGGIVIDFDNDGLKDFIIPAYYSPQGNYDIQYLRFFKNYANGTFLEVTNKMLNPDIKSGKYITGMNDGKAVVFDFNKDGKADFILPSGWENNNYRNYDSIYGIVKFRDYYYKTNPNRLESSANQGFQSMPFYYQDNGIFKKGYNLFDKITFAVNAAPQNADINNDGFDDIILNQGGYVVKDSSIISPLNGLTVWTNDAGKGFTFQHISLVDTAIRYGFGFSDEGGLCIEDFNGDGLKDILMYGFNSPYKFKDPFFTQSQKDSVLWDMNYFTMFDTSRPSIPETRVYINSNGQFDSKNYFIIPNLKAKFAIGTDLNNDGKIDIIALWKNYRSGGFNGVYTDSLTNKDGVNNKFSVFINKGSNAFEDQTSKYFPFDKTSFNKLSSSDFIYKDIDGDGLTDFFPISGGDDTLRNTYGTYATDTAGSHATVYYKNFSNNYFRKQIIDSFFKIKNWINYPLIKNIDTMYNTFYIPFTNQNSLTPVKGEYLLDNNYFLNHFYIDDFNNDGKVDLFGFTGYDNKMQDYINKKFGYYDNLRQTRAMSLLIQCNPPKPIFNTTNYSFCIGDSLKLTVTNINKGDTLKWYYGTKADLTNVSSKIFTDSTKLFVIRTDSIGCTISSDTVQLIKYSIPSKPAIAWNGTQFIATTTSTGVNYQWLLSNSLVSGATSSNYKPTAIGSYKIQITDANACKNLSDGFMLVVTAVNTSIETSTDHIAKIVPNPASTNVLLYFQQKPNQTLTIQLLNLKGQVLKQTNTNSQSTRISLSEIIAGNYIIQIIGKGYNQTQQLLITQ